MKMSRICHNHSVQLTLGTRRRRDEEQIMTKQTANIEPTTRKPHFLQNYISGPSCSKLTMSLVNVLLNIWSLNMAYRLIVLLKKCAKATHIFFSKNTCELDIVLTRTVNILTTNELVKLTVLWTTGPSLWWIFNINKIKPTYSFNTFT